MISNRKRFERIPLKDYNRLDWEEQQMLPLHLDILQDLNLPERCDVYGEEVRGVERNPQGRVAHHDISVTTATRTGLPIEAKVETYPSDNAYFELAANLPVTQSTVVSPCTVEWGQLYAAARAAVTADPAKAGLILATVPADHAISYIRIANETTATWRLIKTQDFQQWVTGNLHRFRLSVSKPRTSAGNKGNCVSIGVLIPDAELNNLPCVHYSGEITEEAEPYFDALRAKAEALRVKAQKEIDDILGDDK